MAPEPPEIPGLFTDYETKKPFALSPIKMWNKTFIRKNVITRKCLVTKVHWYKGRGSTQREFLRFDISSPDKVHSAILMAEKAAGDSGDSEDRPSGTTEPTDTTTPPANPMDSVIGPDTPSVTITPPFASPNVAGDSAASSADEATPNIARDKSTVTDRKKQFKADRSSRNVSYYPSPISWGYNNEEVVHATLDSIAAVPMERKCKHSDFISALTFPKDAGPSANQIGTLLVVTSALEPMYRLMNMQYCWFAATVFEALKRLFPGAKQDFKKHNGGGSRWIWIPQKSSVDAVCEKYGEARTALDVEIEQERRAEQERGEARRREIEERWAAVERKCEQCQVAEERERQATEEALATLSHLRRELEALREEASPDGWQWPRILFY
ncbi:hypothetical protein EDD15DRAFT_2365913 [Pisolithus albus]|nr:hypothetical protein EDD15DRAFT_2365913 [Pisolithus albus]